MKKIIIFLSVVLIFAVFAGCNADKQGDTSSAAPNESVADTGDNPSADESVPDVDISGAESDASIPDDDVSVETSGDYDPGVDTSAEQSAPETSAPEVSQPEVSEPEVSEPEVSNPEVSKPEVSEPEVSEPEVSEPDEDKVLVKIPTPVVPAVTTPVWDGSIADGFASGTGTEDDPFIIETAAQLAYFALSVDEGNDYYGQFVKLANNIKLNDGNLNVKELDGTGLNKWNAIGENQKKFSGTFDGDGHVISGIYGSEGLFKVINGTVKNVGITNSHIVGSGALADAANSGAQQPLDIHLIDNCYVVESVIEAEGGLLRSSGAYNITDCYNGATLYASGDWSGGIVGMFMNGSLTNCYNAGTLDGASPYGNSGTIGGLIGNLLGGNLTDCYNVGNIINYSFSGGAICGVRYDRTVIKDCGYLKGTALYAYTDANGTGEQVISNDEIIVLTEEQIDY